MKIQQVFTLGLRDEQRPIVAEAARIAFPQATVTTLTNFKEAQEWPPSVAAMLVLVDPPADLVGIASGAKDDVGLLHWPVVVLSDEKPDGDVAWVGAGEWTVPVLVRSFQSAAQKHALLRENARLRGDLLTISRRVNHDLRSSLNGVVTASEVLKEILTADSPGDVELVQPVIDSAAEIARLIDQVSFIAKATAAPAAPQELAMDELVWKGLSRVERRIHEKQARVTHADSWPTVFGVASWIETIWTNLLLNALDHSGLQPQIELDWREEDTVFRFWVDDHGPGVAVERQSSLFTPFHRLAEVGAARGFGLSVTQRLLELQGGSGGYEKREDRGTRFYFTLPKPPQ
jgi:signal transduction histidine kinase